MNRRFLRSFVFILALLGIASTASSHHLPRFERCMLVTFSGELERIEWAYPHVLLFVRTEDGTTQELGWLDVRGLAREGIERDTLHVGDQLEVQGGFRPNDISKEPILVSSIRRPSDGWEWSQTPQGC